MHWICTLWIISSEAETAEMIEAQVTFNAAYCYHLLFLSRIHIPEHCIYIYAYTKHSGAHSVA
jgi:hypothetical protein